MGKGKGSIRKRRNWRDKAFEILGSRNLNSVPKGDRSNTLKNILKSRKKNSGDITKKKK